MAGTVYMDMPLKPNILEDLTKEVCIAVWLLFREPSDSGARLSRRLLLPAVPMPTRPTRLRLRS